MRVKTMQSDKQYSTIMGSALDVWLFLQKEGGLNIRLYDKEIILEIKRLLSLPEKGNLETLLHKNAINSEDFIVAFFRAVQPFANMMSELLKMFENAGAKRTDKNFRVAFNFGKNFPSLEFNLNHFRDYIETWTRITSLYLVNVWDSSLLWVLNGVLRDRNVTVDDVDDLEFNNWYKEYMEYRNWSVSLPSAPKSHDPYLDKKLSRVWQVWTTVVKESMKYGSSRDNLRKIWSEYRRERDISGINDLNKEDWPVDLLAGIDSDHWAGSLALGTYYKAEAISKLNVLAKGFEAKKLADKLDKILQQVPQIESEGSELVRQLEEFLSLPIWKRRHELYSAWISTQIISALGNENVRIHHYEGVISFSFSGTHLATVDNLLPRLHIWAELRSPLKGPKGKGRKKAIQPDYSLVPDPVTCPQASVLEVECKQYLKPSKKNFSNALSDYARGRPNALVVLVNYGGASDSILEDVDENVRERTFIVGDMRPRSEIAINKFKQIVAKAIYKRYGLKTEFFSEDEKVVGQIRLLWGKTPEDLDLHLEITSRENKYHIYYKDMDQKDFEPWADLDNDIRNGTGPENIMLYKWIIGKYHCFVHNFSEDRALAGCEAIVEFNWKGETRSFCCPNEGDGELWSVFTLDTSTWEITEVNKIVSL